MWYGNERLSPSDIPTLFSGLVGGFTVKFVHAHDLQRLIELNLLWLGWLALIFLRGKFRGGKLLNFEAGAYQVFAISFYLIGFVMVCVYYLVYSTN